MRSDCNLTYLVLNSSIVVSLTSAVKFQPDTETGKFSLSENIRQLLHACLKLVWKSSRVKSCRREKTCKESQPPGKPKKKKQANTEDVECVWSLQSLGDEAGKLSDGWTAAESWRVEREEEEAEAFFNVDTLIQRRGSREIKAARRLKERKRRLR